MSTAIVLAVEGAVPQLVNPLCAGGQFSRAQRGQFWRAPKPSPGRACSRASAPSFGSRSTGMAAPPAEEGMATVVPPRTRAMFQRVTAWLSGHRPRRLPAPGSRDLDRWGRAWTTSQLVERLLLFRRRACGRPSRVGSRSAPPLGPGRLPTRGTLDSSRPTSPPGRVAIGRPTPGTTTFELMPNGD